MAKSFQCAEGSRHLQRQRQSRDGDRRVTGTHSLLAYRLAGRIAEREAILTAFMSDEQDRIVSACLDMARAFERGGKLIVFGTGSAELDAHRVASEFTNPMAPGRRALPALALGQGANAARLKALAGPHDIALGLTHSSWDAGVDAFLTEADQLGLIGVACGAAGSRRSRSLARSLDHALIVPSDDPFIAQELQTTIHHLLWQLIQVFLEHLECREDRCITCGDVAFTGRVIALSNGVATIETQGFTEEVAVDLIDRIAVNDLLLCHAGVALQKLSAAESRDANQSASLRLPLPGREDSGFEAALETARATMLRASGEASALRRAIELSALERCAATVRDRLDRGGRLISLGSGRSCTQALDLAADFIAHGWPAIAVTPEPANEGDGDGAGESSLHRRLRAVAGGADIVVAITTSASSVDLLAPLEEARDLQLLTCAIAGEDGSPLAELDWIDHLLPVPSDSDPHIQEVEATICHLLLEAIGER